MAPPPMYTAVASQPPPQPVVNATPSSNPPIIPELSIKDSPLAGALDGDGQNMTIAAPPKDALDELLQDFTEFVQTELVKQEDKNNTGKLNIVRLGLGIVFREFVELIGRTS